MLHRKAIQPASILCILLLQSTYRYSVTYAKSTRSRTCKSLFPTSSSSILFGIRGGAPSIATLKNYYQSSTSSNNKNTNGTFQTVQEKVKKNTTSVQTRSSVILGGDDNGDSEYKRALIKTLLTLFAAATFGITVMMTRGVSSGYEFFAGYLIEQSLSIDNLFVFIMLFEYFKVPTNLQNRVLSWGISGAIILRGLMIGVGVAALQRFQSIILVFASILIASSVNLLLENETHDSSTGTEQQHEENLVMKLTKALFPNTSSELHGEKFFIEVTDNGVTKHMATPLFLCLLAVELSDFVFAVDSIPAVLGVSKDPLIVYASNIFAIMALRSLYTVVAKAVSSFRYLKPAVALVLGFVGAKMIAEYFHIEIGTGASLAVICSLLSTGIVASILNSQEERNENYVTIDASTVTNSTATM